MEIPAFMMAIMNGVEVIIIILVGLLIIFGAKKIPELAKSFGKATSEFEKARIEARRELHDIKNKDSSVLGREKLEAIAETLGIDYTNKNDEQLRFAIETEINKNKNK
ncbi:MAG: twin-arginine translocase TatA/TatE family subunit [Candidatus Nitrosopolaris sp.]